MLVCAGSRSFTGAAFLCSCAAMRAGAGYVTLAVPDVLHRVFASKAREIVTLPVFSTPGQSISEKALPQVVSAMEKADVLLLGCGMSQDPSTQRFIRRLISLSKIPMVIDADGLNALAGHIDMLKACRAPVVLTPHPKEMSRIAEKGLREVLDNAKNIAKDFSLRYNVTLILKGYRSLVVSVEGKVYRNNTGNPGMASAGTGDVLSGIVAAFLAQGMGPFEAACRAVYAHGLSGDLAAKEKTQPSLIASDIIEYLPKAFKKCSKDVEN